MSSSTTIFTNDLIGRHLVIQKAKILKGKSRIIEIRAKSGVQLVNPNPYEVQKLIPWGEISEIVASQKSENEFTIIHGKKNTKNFSIEGGVSRVTVLSDLYCGWKSNQVKVFSCEKVDRLSERVPVALHVNVWSYETSKNNVRSKPTKFENIKKISKVTSEESAFVIHSKQFRKQLFFASNRDEIIQSIVSNASTFLGKTISVDVLNNCDDLFTLTEDNLSQIMYSVTVKKNKGGEEKNDERKIAIDKRTIYEIDTSTKRVISTHRFRQIGSIVRCASSDTKFVIQYHTHSFEYESAERDDLISSILELSERDKVVIPVRSRVSPPGCRVGDPEIYSKELYEYILKRIATMKKVTDKNAAADIMEEFIDNYSISNHIAQISDKKATQYISDMMTKYTSIQSLSEHELTLLLESFIPVMTLTDPFNNFSTLSKTLLKFLYQCISSHKAHISYLACTVLKACIDEMHPHKTDKKEISNKLLVLQPDGLNVLFGALKYGLENLSTHTLLVSSVLSLMESCCISAKSTTDRNMLRTIALSFSDHLDHLFDLAYSSRSVPIVYNSLILARIALQFKACEKALTSIQAKALKSGHLLQQVHICISTKDSDVCTIASDIVAFLVDGCAEAAALLTRIVPPILLKQLGTHKGTVYPLQKKMFVSDKPTPSSQSPLGVPPINDWHPLFEGLASDVSSFRIIWNESMRNELLESVSKELNEFVQYKREYKGFDVLWNYEEFEITYGAVTSEPSVAGYFIRPFVATITEQGWTNEHLLIPNPQQFIDELHHTIMFNDSVDIKKLCLQASALLYLRFIGSVSYYGLEHICLLLRRNIKNLSLVSEILNFFLAVLATDSNAEKFIDAGGIDFITELVTLVHQVDSTNEDTLIYIQVADRCLKIFIRLITLHSPVNSAGSLYVPQPNAQYIMCRKNILQCIVQLLLAYEQSDDIFQQTVQLLNHLVDNNEELISNLYSTGVFYFLLLYSGSNVEGAITLLKRTHLLQSLHCEERRTGISTPDASPIIQSILNELLPKELICRLNKLSIEEFSALFIADYVATPDVIWSSDMREHLRSCLSKHLDSFRTALRSDRFAEYQFSNVSPVEYDVLKMELVCSNYYISNFVRTESWPANFSLENVEEFASGVTSCLDYLLAMNPKLSDQTMGYLSMCIRAQLIVLKRQSIATYQNYSIPKPLLEILRRSREEQECTRALYCLQYQCSILLLELVRCSPNNIYSFMQHSVCSDICLLVNHCASHCNSSQLRSSEDRSTSLNEYFSRRTESVQSQWIQPGDDYLLIPYNEHEIMAEIIDFSLNILFFLLASFEDTCSQIAESITIVDDLIRCLLIPERKTPNIFHNTLKILSILSSSVLVQDRAFKSGLHIHLLSIIMDCALERIEFSLTVELAVQCFRRLAGWSRDDSHPYGACKEFSLMLKALNQIFPMHVIQSLCRKPSPSFIDDDLKYPKETPVTIWNKQTLQELDMYIQQEKIALEESSFDFSSIFSFTYQTHECELRASGIFVRLYNNTIGSFVVETPDNFVQECCVLWKSELERMDKSKRLCIDSNEFHRITILLEAIYIIFKQNDSLRKLSFISTDMVPLLVELLRVEVQYSRAIFYVLHIIYMLIRSAGAEIITALVNAGMIESVRDILYSHTFSDHPAEVVGDIHDNLLTVLYFIYSSDVNGKAAAKSINCGLLLYILAQFCDCFKKHEHARVKSSYLLSRCIISQVQARELMNQVFPKILVEIIEKNPMEAVSSYEKMHEYPEFIWNQQMRQVAKETIHKWLNEHNAEITRNSAAECTQYGSIVYEYPRQVAGIYVQMYNNHPNYPIPHFYDYVVALVKDIDSTVDDDQKKQSAYALHLCCGGEYYNKSTVPILCDSIPRITFHMLNSSTSTQTHMLQTLTKMSMDNSCLNRFNEHPTFMDEMSECIEKIHDHQEELIMIVLRVATKNAKIIEQCSSHESSICSLLINIVNGNTHSIPVRELAAKTLKYLATRSSGLLDKLNEDNMYETKIAPYTALCQDELFTSLIAPPIHPGGAMGYMGINLNKKDENELESKRLFEQLLKQTYYLQKLISLEQNKLNEPSSRISVNITKKAEEPVVVSPSETPTRPTPPSSPPSVSKLSTPTPPATPPPSTKLEATPSTPPAIDTEETIAPISADDVLSPMEQLLIDPGLQEIKFEDQETLSEIEVDDEESNISHDSMPSSTNIASSPPPPPPMIPRSLNLDVPTKRFSMNSSLMSDIQRGIALKSPTASPRSTPSPISSPTSLGADFLSKMNNRRSHIRDDESGSGSDYDSE